jgi:hypothetical protein
VDSETRREAHLSHRTLPRPQSRRWLMAAAALSAAIALLHVAVILSGPSAYAFFGAPDLGALEAGGSRVPDLVTAGIVAVFALWAYYAWAGAGRSIRRPPLLLAGLFTIGAIYTLRGLAVVPEILSLVRGNPPFPPRYALFSAVSLGIGICYLAGAWLRRAEAAEVTRPG